MTSCPFGYQSGESGHQRPRATTTGVLPPATRLVRTVRGRDANSRPSPEIGKGDPSKCCTGVQTSAMPVVRFPLKLRAHDPRTSHNAPRPLSGPAPDFRVAIGENSRIFRQPWRDAQPGRYSDRAIAASVRCSASTIPPMGRIARRSQSTRTPRSNPAAALAQEVLPAMSIHKPRSLALTVLLLVAVATGAGYPTIALARDEAGAPASGPGPDVRGRPRARPARKTGAGRRRSWFMRGAWRSGVNAHLACRPGPDRRRPRGRLGPVPDRCAADVIVAPRRSSAPSPWRPAMVPAGSSSTPTTISPPPTSRSGPSK